MNDEKKLQKACKIILRRLHIKCMNHDVKHLQKSKAWSFHSIET